MMRLEAGRACLVVDLERGGRIASFVVDGHELLVTSGFGPFGWGSFPMVPFAGRLRNARLAFESRTYELPPNDPPHAIHGFLAERPWHVLDDEPAAITCELGPPWPFRGRARQRFDLGPDRLEATMELETDEPQPAVIGWHPWFRRRLVGAEDDRGGELELDVEPAAMYLRDPDGLPTGQLVQPGPRPWDDCVTGLARPPVLRWPGVLRLTVESTVDDWVVYDEETSGICLEPQTGPPDGPNFAPRIVRPGEPLRMAMTWRWAPEELAGGSHAAPED
jgi:aldose 1-epimerase